MSPRYRAPETFRNEFSNSSEVYSFGIVAWEVLTGRVPWEKDEKGREYSEQALMMAIVREKRPALEPAEAASAIGKLVQRCWAQEPADRPAFAAVARELEAAGGNENSRFGRAHS